MYTIVDFAMENYSPAKLVDKTLENPKSVYKRFHTIGERALNSKDGYLRKSFEKVYESDPAVKKIMDKKAMFPYITDKFDSFLKLSEEAVKHADSDNFKTASELQEDAKSMWFIDFSKMMNKFSERSPEFKQSYELFKSNYEKLDKSVNTALETADMFEEVSAEDEEIRKQQEAEAAEREAAEAARKKQEAEERKKQEKKRIKEAAQKAKAEAEALAKEAETLSSDDEKPAADQIEPAQ